MPLQLIKSYLAFVDFVNRGGNLFVTADSTIGPAIQELANQFGVEYDEPGKKVICHIQEDNTMDDGDHTSFAIKSAESFSGNRVFCEFYLVGL